MRSNAVFGWRFQLKKTRCKCNERVPTGYKKNIIRLDALQIRHDAFKRKINVFFLKVGVQTQPFRNVFFHGYLVKKGHLSEIRLYVSKGPLFICLKSLKNSPNQLYWTNGNPKFYHPWHLTTRAISVRNMSHIDKEHFHAI